jgi:hypothetical protein
LGVTDVRRFRPRVGRRAHAADSSSGACDTDFDFGSCCAHSLGRGVSAVAVRCGTGRAQTGNWNHIRNDRIGRQSVDGAEVNIAAVDTSGSHSPRRSPVGESWRDAGKFRIHCGLVAESRRDAGRSRIHRGPFDRRVHQRRSRAARQLGRH